MRIPTVAIGAKQSAAAVSVFSYGEFGRAMASYLAAGGHDVQVIGGITPPPKNCEIHTLNQAHYNATTSIQVASSLSNAIRPEHLLLICTHGTEYGAVCEDLAPVLASGQTLFLIGSPFGGALEMAHRLAQKRADLSLNIVEVEQPFAFYNISETNVSLFGVKSRLVLAGRSLNETRAGLSAGNSLFNSLVPGSNLLERGFANIDRWLDTAAILFDVFNSSKESLTASIVGANEGNLPSNTHNSGKFPIAGGMKKTRESGREREPIHAVLTALQGEISALARAYRVSRVSEHKPSIPDLTPSILRQELGRRVVEDFVILSSLARNVYLAMPVLESLIELSSVVIGTDLRREGRELSDLGLIGMDAREIVELVSA